MEFFLIFRHEACIAALEAGDDSVGERCHAQPACHSSPQAPTIRKFRQAFMEAVFISNRMWSATHMCRDLKRVETNVMHSIRAPCPTMRLHFVRMGRSSSRVRGSGCAGLNYNTWGGGADLVRQWSGNFWWARADYYRTLPEEIERDSYLGGILQPSRAPCPDRSRTSP